MSGSEGGFAAPPYIDAYWNTWGKKTTRKTVDEKLDMYATDWGARAIGEQLLEGKEALQHDGRYVLAIGFHDETKLAAVAAPHPHDAGGTYWFDRVEIVEFDWPGECDVT